MPASPQTVADLKAELLALIDRMADADQLAYLIEQAQEALDPAATDLPQEVKDELDRRKALFDPAKLIPGEVVAQKIKERFGFR